MCFVCLVWFVCVCVRVVCACTWLLKTRTTFLAAAAAAAAATATATAAATVAVLFSPTVWFFLSTQALDTQRLKLIAGPLQQAEQMLTRLDAAAGAQAHDAHLTREAEAVAERAATFKEASAMRDASADVAALREQSRTKLEVAAEKRAQLAEERAKAAAAASNAEEEVCVCVCVRACVCACVQLQLVVRVGVRGIAGTLVETYWLVPSCVVSAGTCARAGACACPGTGASGNSQSQTGTGPCNRFAVAEERNLDATRQGACRT